MNRKTVTRFAVGAALVALGVIGDIAPYELWFTIAGAALMANAALRLTYVSSGRVWPAASVQPRPLRASALDYVKAFVCWLDAFERTFAVEPGLYYLGDRYDRDGPLLVTSNYFLTVFLVARRARSFNARLLVVDTDAINVWCAAGKGTFSNDAVLAQVDRYDRDLLTDGKWLRMVLPKLAFAGVDLQGLREHKIRPIIGPVYSKDIPAYLAATPLRDRNADHVVFGMQSRVFTWLPGLVQFIGFSVAAALIGVVAERIWGTPAPLGIVAIAAILATGYPLLFPWLPGERFSVKGLWLAGMVSVGLGVLAVGGEIGEQTLIAAVLFTFATGIFMGLSYTGNSAVSNYSKVRKETAQFLPVDVLLFAASLVVFFVGGGQS